MTAGAASGPLPTLMDTWARRLAIAITCCSLVVCLGLRAGIAPRHPFGDLSDGHFTDHFSHMNAARLFPRVGIDIWRLAIKDLLPVVSPQDYDRLPADLPRTEVFSVAGWRQGKPVSVHWSAFPRPYPPGDMLLVAPVAAAYHFSALSFSAANRWLILLFLGYAHVGLFFFVLAALTAPPRQRALQWLTTVAVAAYIIRYTLEGFYDAAALAPLLVCARLLDKRRGTAAVIAFCLAAVLHFRTFFFAPWALYGGWLVLQERPWQQQRARFVMQVALITLLAAASLLPFALVWPTLHLLPDSNPIRINGASFRPTWLLLVSAACGLAAWRFFRARAWLDLATLGWFLAMTLFVRQAYGWHGMVLVGWLGAPLWGTSESDGNDVLLARFGSLVSLITLVFYLRLD